MNLHLALQNRSSAQMGRPEIIGQHFEGRTWQADEKGMELTWMFFWVFKRNSTVVDARLQMANEAVEV
jgi:hypothetical protein